ncbi:MAG TPA: DNA-directed RNA polymerase subunit alpha C-terminal domain-containing protein [Ktedonobacteraceae bacterium]|nr:DNA-directed RNA polymerase subunit alpha C-terminal domain-containing protein [Ktedonobacteraceae bacterium]
MYHDDVYATPIEELDLRVRIYNSLKRNQINTVGQLLSMRRKEILAIRTLVPGNFEELQTQLIARGFMSRSHLHGPFAEKDEEHEDE